MSSPQVAWIGSQSFTDLLLNHHHLPPLNGLFTRSTSSTSTSTNTTTRAALGLVLLHGTWNNGRRPTNTGYPNEKELLTSWLQQAVTKVCAHDFSNNSETTNRCLYYAAAVKIDLDDDATCNLLIEGRYVEKQQQQQQQQLPIPPAELPALALILHHQISSSSSSSDIVTLRYVSENVVRPLMLLDALNGDVKTTLYTKTISDAVQTVLKDLLEDSSQIIRVDSVSLLPVQKEDGSAAHDNDDDDALRIFVAGDRSSVGKSSVCLGILGSLLKMGYPAKSLAYIKPATQSESTQLIQLYCEKHGITCVPIGPLVYYRGFTRAFLAGETGSTTASLLKGCQEAVDQVARGRRVVLVDGVGFPAVGSICGTDNASVLCACSYPRTKTAAAVTTTADYSDDAIMGMSRKPMGVVLVGGSGVGGAVDAFNLNACYFEQRHVPVLGAIFNKLSETGFYSLENCKAQISKYFDQQQEHDNGNLHPNRGIPFGFLPLFPVITSDKAMDHVEEFISIFSSRVDVAAILDAARQVKERDETSTSSKTLAAPTNKTTSYDTNTTTMEPIRQQSPPKRRKLMATAAAVDDDASNSAAGSKKTRQEIEGLAITGGAAPSA